MEWFYFHQINMFFSKVYHMIYIYIFFFILPSILTPGNAWIRGLRTVAPSRLYASPDSIGTSTNPSTPKLFVVISNLQSGSNIGSICRNALAFNASGVVVVGRRGFRDKMRQADRGAKQLLNFFHFDSLNDAEVFLRQEQTCTLVGVEIMDSARAITSRPFTREKNTAFLFGNEGGGLSERQRKACDSFVYIPQYASGGMASINVACASAIVFHTFAEWAGYPETTRQGEKFI